MYLLAKFGGHRSYRNGGINSYINFCKSTLKKAELTVSIRNVARFLKSGILSFNIKVPNTVAKRLQQRQLQSVLRFTQLKECIRPNAQ